MALGQTETTSLSAPVKQYFDKLLLDRLEKNFVLAPMADKRPLPKGSGKTIEFTRYLNMTPITTPISEGVKRTQGDAEIIAAETLTAAIEQYGNHVEYSDIFETVKIDPGLKEIVELLGYNASESVDTVVRDKIRTGASAFWGGTVANSKATLTSGDRLNAIETRRMATELKKNNVMPKAGSDYVAVIHPVNASDLQADSAAGGWAEIRKYDQPGELFTGEIGKLFGVRFVVSSNLTADDLGGGTGDIPNTECFFMGRHAFAMTELAGHGLKFMFSAPKPSSDDPLAQVGTAGWKATYAVRVLDSTTDVSADSKRLLKLGVASGTSTQ